MNETINNTETVNIERKVYNWPLFVLRERIIDKQKDVYVDVGVGFLNFNRFGCPYISLILKEKKYVLLPKENNIEVVVKEKKASPPIINYSITHEKKHENVNIFEQKVGKPLEVGRENGKKISGNNQKGGLL